MNVPFVDLKSQYNSIKNEIDQAIQDVINQSAFIGGPFVKRFEQEFGQYISAKHCIGCANGTDGLQIVLKALDIGLND